MEGTLAIDVLKPSREFQVVGMSVNVTGGGQLHRAVLQGLGRRDGADEVRTCHRCEGCNGVDVASVMTAVRSCRLRCCGHTEQRN